MAFLNDLQSKRKMKEDQGEEFGEDVKMAGYWPSSFLRVYGP